MHRTLLAVAIAAAAASGIVFLAHAKELALSIDDLQAPGFSAQSVRATFAGPRLRQLTLDVDRLTAAGHVWRKVKLHCPELDATGARIACSRGVLDAGEKIPVSFSYIADKRELVVELKPAADEILRVEGRIAGSDTALRVRIDQARLNRYAAWLPAGTPKITDGRVTGELQIQGTSIKARLEVAGVGFSDARGLHAGEKISATLEADATGKGDDWRWNTRIAWRAGEVFWQPLFLKANAQRLRAEGVSTKGRTEVREGTLEVPGVGSVAFNGRWNHAAGTLEVMEARAAGVRAASLYEQILKPLLQGTALADLRMEGEATVSLKTARAAVTSLDLQLDGVSLEDRQRRFALFGLTGRIAWRGEEPGTGELAMKGGEVFKLPFGAARIPLRMRGLRVAFDSARIPILDGALQLRDFAAGSTNEGWRWRLSGELEPISMVQLTQTLGMPVMRGSLSGVIPEVRYRRRTLALDGALLVRVFDGTISASNVELIEPFGRAPRLHANMDAKALDLELLTGTFDFGTITGRIDSTVRGLELSNWEPVRFDARIESSPGKYPRRISQRAVQNISALGGAGAAAAIQRSFLRFFEQFGYAKIGVSCRLTNGICEMDGIESAPQGYVIVKGGGIPAITVIGYNRSVSWRELLERLKRITQENVKPIVK